MEQFHINLKRFEPLVNLIFNKNKELNNRMDFKVRNKQDFKLGLGFLGVSLFFLYFSYIQPKAPGLRVTRGGLSPQSFPVFVLWIITFLSILLIIGSILHAPMESIKKIEKNRFIKVSIAIFFSFLYIFLMNTIGYLFSTILMFGVYIFFLGGRNWKIIIPLVIIIPVALYYFFGHFMDVLLP